MQLRRLGALPVLLVSLSVASGHATAFGNDDRWVSGWGQGIAEAIITHGPGNQIYVTCNQGAADYVDSGISFTLGGMSPTGSVILTFDNEDPERFGVTDGQITSNCRACAGTYEYVVNRLKRHNSVHVLFENGDSARFTLAGSSEAIAECVPDFYR